MTSIIYVGMDVHKLSHTLCYYNPSTGEISTPNTINSDFKNILKYLETVKRQVGENSEFICGYEAGSLGYSLYHQLTKHGVKCVIIAPTTMPRYNKNKLKNDKSDSVKIAMALAHNNYSPVFVPNDEDDAVKEYLRMRCDEKKALKKIKQQIIALYTRHGLLFTDGRSHWTVKHLSWIKDLDLGNALLNETLKEYMILFNQTSDKLTLYDLRIEEIANTKRYQESVKKLSCFLGIRTHTALALIVEVGDYKRFKKAKNFTAYLGLTPGEYSSGNTTRRTSITKAGNSHLRRLLIEAAQCYNRGSGIQKSKALLSRQSGNLPEVIAYADKATMRLRKKFCRMFIQKSKINVIVTALARELACFIWGMMTANFN